ncbi:hypothetical protein ACX80S_18455 [Arthrobacter sp. RHLT1-20]
MALHQTLLFRQWSPNITLFLNDVVVPTEEKWEQLAARSINVVEGKVQSLEVTDDALSGVVLASRTVLPVEAVVTGPRMEARSAVESLGSPQWSTQWALVPTHRRVGITGSKSADSAIGSLLLVIR